MIYCNQIGQGCPNFVRDNNNLYVFLIDKISIEIQLNAGSTTDQYKEKIGSLLTLHLKIYRYDITVKTPSGNEFH